MKLRSVATRMMAVVALATSVAALGVAGPAAAAERVDDASEASKQERKGPEARTAFCPPCAIVAVTAIRAAVVRAAPVAARAASKLVSKGRKARARVKSGATRAKKFARDTRTVTRAQMVRIFTAMPRVAKGCSRGLLDHIRDYGSISLLRAFYACGRGILENYLGKDPLGPINN